MKIIIITKINEIMATGSTLKFSFLCGIRGFHQYWSVWVPTVNEILQVEQEMSNPHDVYAIAVKKRLPGSISESIVGCLPRKVSGSPTSLFFGARASYRVTDIPHRRSPLVQGGLEIPAEVTIEMTLIEKNTLALNMRPWY